MDGFFMVLIKIILDLNRFRRVILGQAYVYEVTCRKWVGWFFIGGFKFLK